LEHNLTERNYSKQYHLIVNAQYALLPNEIDLVLTMLTEIKKEDEDFKTYSFTKAELEKKTNRKWDSMQLKDTVKGLMSKPLEIKVKENIKGKEFQYWQIFNWFSSFRYRSDGIITCRFDADLKPYLLGIKERFVISDLRMMLLMKSSYSKRIYLLLKEYSKIGHREFELETMHSLLKTPKSHKDRYSKFRQSVLDRSMKDINKFTDLKIEYQVFKRAKKIVRVKFIIRKNDTDLKTFIQIIRELHPNQDLHEYEGRMVRCSDKGLLYWAGTLHHLSKENAKKSWEYLHENRKDLEFIKQNRRELEETLRRLEGGVKK
jgi:plasmid replication initiation protein